LEIWPSADPASVGGTTARLGGVRRSRGVVRTKKAEALTRGRAVA
jgi:hypothetical protein